MTSARAVLPRATAISEARRAYLTRAARLARARVVPFLLTFMLLFQVFGFLRSGALVGLTTERAVDVVLATAVYQVIAYPLLFAAIVLTEALALRRTLHMLASFVALVLANSMAITILVSGEINNPLLEANAIVSETAFVLRSFWDYVGAGMLLVTYFAFREFELAAAKAAQDANTERAMVERATLAARLKVMQARVEPELLFGALRDVRDLYLRDRDAADALLDDIIIYLRAALPQMRGDASTLGREADLAVAYAKVLPAARRGELVAQSAIAEDAYGLAFPPMILLPLVRAAAESSASNISIAMEDEIGRGVAVRIEPGRRPATWDDAGLETVRAALALGLGPGATLEISGGQAVVRWN